MSCKIVLFFLLRFNILLLSLGTLGCHITQLILLGQENNTGNWWPDYIPYILYYVGPVVSILSVLILIILGCVKSRSLLSDRIISVINLLLFIGIVVYISLESGTVPWTGALPSKQFTASNTKGWANYCPNYTDGLLSVRCWLQNGTWLGIIIVGFMWLVLALYTIIIRNSDMYHDDYDAYDYKEDVPMAQRRASSSINKQQSVIYNNSSNNNQFVPPPAPNTPAHQQEAYYYETRPQQYDSGNLNPDYYLNPVQEEHQNHSNHYVAGAGEGFERSRKTSKTFLEELSPNHSNITPSNDSVQPPHSYDGATHNS